MIDPSVTPTSIVISVVKDSVDVPQVLTAYWDKGYDIVPVIQSDEGKVMFDITKPGELWISIEEVVSQAPWGDEVQGVAEFYAGTRLPIFDGGVFPPPRISAYSRFQEVLRNRMAFTFKGTKLTEFLG